MPRGFVIAFRISAVMWLVIFVAVFAAMGGFK